MNEEFLINLWNYRKKMYLCSAKHIIQRQAEACHIVVGYFYAYMPLHISIFGAQPRGSRLMPSQLPLCMFSDGKWAPSFLPYNSINS